MHIHVQVRNTATGVYTEVEKKSLLRNKLSNRGCVLDIRYSDVCVCAFGVCAVLAVGRSALLT